MKVSDSSLLGTTEFKFNLRCDIAGIFQCHTVQPLLSFGMPTFSTGSRVGLRFFLLSVCRLLLSLSWFFSFPHSPLRWDNVWVTAENSDGIPCRRRFCCCRFWYWLVPVPFHTLRYVVCSPYALCICVCVCFKWHRAARTPPSGTWKRYLAHPHHKHWQVLGKCKSRLFKPNSVVEAEKNHPHYHCDFKCPVLNCKVATPREQKNGRKQLVEIEIEKN